jgi:hypothetical protein
MMAASLPKDKHYQGIGSFDEGRGFPHGGRGTMKWEHV